MDTVIYSASLFRAFLSPFGSILFTGLFAVAAFTAAVLQKKQGKGARIAMAVCGLVLLVFSFVTASLVFTSISSGTQTVAMRVNDKNIGTSTNDNGGSNTDYILSAAAGLVSYDILVNSKTYDLAQVNSCYQITYYKYKSLLHSTPNAEMYQRIEMISRIEVADPAACP